METGALFSEDKKYRYALFRIWEADKGILMFVGLNPSTANENKNDNTISKLEKITANNGYGGFYMMNLFGLVTAYPKILKENFDIAIGDNDKHLKEYSQFAKKIVFCWGNFKEAKERGEIVKKMFPNIQTAYLHLNKNGSPKHPLYCLDTQEIKNFNITK